MISFLWAMDENGVIGKNNDLPWHLPEDLNYFKRTTDGHPIVMGRKTFDSIGRPLPRRENVILTRNVDFEQEGCIILNTLDEVLQFAQERDTETFIIGGKEIFNQLLPYADKLYVTLIYDEFEGDTSMPSIPWDNFQCISSEKGKKDQKNPYDYEFKVFKRK